MPYSKIRQGFSPLLFLFAGQGTQQKGMLEQLLAIREARQEIEHYSKAINLDFIEIASTDKNDLIHKTSVTQPLIVLSQALHFKYLGPKLQRNDFMIGHSVGEYSALTVAGSISLERCLKLVQKRGQLMEEYATDKSGMLVVRFSTFLLTQTIRINPKCLMK